MLPRNLKHLPRLTLTDLLLQQALSASTILWHELAGEGCKCDVEAEDLVDLIVATLAQLDQLQRCMGKRSQ